MSSQRVNVPMVSTVLSGQNKWDHCTHLTWNLGHRMKWDHYKHPLSYHFVLCWGDLFSLDHVCGYPYALLKGQCVHGLYSIGGAEQVRPLHTPYLKSGSQDEVRPLQAPLIISLCALLGWSFLIRSCLWVSICAPKGSVCPWFVQFWRGRTSETTAHTLLEIWVTGWSETTTSTSCHITLCFVGGDLFSLDYICGYQYELPKGQCAYGFYSFVWAEQVRPLHTPYLKSGSQDEVRPLQASFIIPICALLGWSFQFSSVQFSWFLDAGCEGCLCVQIFVCLWG